MPFSIRPGRRLIRAQASSVRYLLATYVAPETPPRDSRLPVNVDPFDSRLDDELDTQLVGRPLIASSRSRAKRSSSGFSESASENYGVLSIGAGFVMNHTVTLRPTASFPVRLKGAKPSFGLSLGFNFGSR